MLRCTLWPRLVAPLILLAVPAALIAQPARQASRARTAQQKIADATSAAPAMISSKATVMDWPESEGGESKQLRAGSNGWVCFPTTPKVFASAAGRDPMCLDEAWQAWAQAWMSKGTPQIKAVGIGYMLRGDAGASNTDPFATEKTADNNWVHSGPHIMVIVPDVDQLKGFNTDPTTGAPWVMWQGTPYAHIMVPVAPPRAHPTAARSRPRSP
ncbi:MAG: hypothetical protein ABR499_02760 [Gemmatimonadaceae bacterium]